LQKVALKIGATFEPKSAATGTSAATAGASVVAPVTVVAPATTTPALIPVVVAPSAPATVLAPTSDPKANSAGLITKQGRWMPPAENTPAPVAATTVAKEGLSLAAAGAVVLTTVPEHKAPHVSEHKAPHVSEPAKVEQPKSEVKAEAKHEVKEAPKVVEEQQHQTQQHKEEKSGEPGKEEWEMVNAADLSREIEQRVAASQLVEEKEKEPAVAPLPKKIEAIRYDDISYNPLEDKEGKKKYSKEVKTTTIRKDLCFDFFF
jgi:hypothetical protein